ncbi:MAG: hypothetical protein J6Z11_00435 [Candidatus Riflebacteria bacterium]|nr:hypothetical protein [Candidatus Riflebacteria bacterium]
MKDMFYNYDNNIDKNLQNRPHFPAGYPAVLESDPNISIVKDAKDREIGVRVRHNMPFTLYFYLDDYTNAMKVSDIPNLRSFVLNSLCYFEVVSNKHNVIFSISQPAINIFDLKSSKLAINVSQEQANLLKKDTYRMQLVLSTIGTEHTIGSSYILFDEDDGLLIVR